MELDSGKTITSVDGKNAYLLIADQKTRMIWTYCSNTKAAPVKEMQAILSKFKSKNPHRTVRTDQDKALARSVELLPHYSISSTTTAAIMMMPLSCCSYYENHSNTCLSMSWVG